MALNKRQWECLIKQIASNSKQIFWTEHAKQRIRSRHISMPMALDVLCKGVIRLEPEPDIKTGHTICRMERYTGGKIIGVCAALASDKACKLIVVTALILAR